MPWENTPASKAASQATYGSREYQANRGKALDRDNRRCQLRLEGCAVRATQVDHITPVSQGGSHALSNLRSACTPCHRKKTANEGGGYRRPSSVEDPAPRPSTQW